MSREQGHSADRARWAERLRACRLARGLTQAALAAAVGVHAATVAHWEDGTRLPRRALWAGLAAALGVPVATLFGPGDAAAEAPAVEAGEEGPPRDPGAWAAARRRLGWSLADMAAAMQVAPAVWAEWEAGVRPMPPAVAERAAWLLGQGPALQGRGETGPGRPVPLRGRRRVRRPEGRARGRTPRLWVPWAIPGDEVWILRDRRVAGAGLAPGDAVLVRRVEAGHPVADGSWVVVEIAGSVRLARWRQTPDGGRLEALGALGRPEPLDAASGQVLGVVLAGPWPAPGAGAGPPGEPARP